MYISWLLLTPLQKVQLFWGLVENPIAFQKEDMGMNFN